MKYLLTATLALGISAITGATDISNLRAGKLAEAGIAATEKTLTISGTMNAADFSYILDNLGSLESLNIAAVTIVEYSGDALPYTGVTSSPANTLPDYALTGLTKLKSINLPASLTAIGKGALSGSGITSLTVPASVTSIAPYAAMRCESLQSISIPESVTEIGARAFAYCPELTTVSIAASIAQIPEGLFEACGGLKNVSLEALADCTEIGPWAFAECNGVQTLVLPSALSEITQGALYAAKGISALVLPQGTSYLGNNAMGNMTGLKSINVAEIASVPELGNDVWVNVDKPKVMLIAPDGMEQEYRDSPQWQDFNIVSQSSTQTIPSTVNADGMIVSFSDGTLHIASGSKELGTIAIFNAAGQRMLSTKAKSSVDITVGGWPAGVYLVISELGAAKIAF